LRHTPRPGRSPLVYKIGWAAEQGYVGLAMFPSARGFAIGFALADLYDQERERQDG
jgi:hypothetical protein